MGGPAAPVQETVLYQGVCLKRENSFDTVAGDCVITQVGMYYYSRKAFRDQTGKKQPDFIVYSRDVAEIRTSHKNMNKVMELYMRDGSCLEFYSPKFAKMLEAMQQAVYGGR